MDTNLFPLRSLPWKSGLVDAAPVLEIEQGPFGDPDDFQEIALLLRTCGA